MSFTTANLPDVVKSQFLFKLKANIDSFSALVGIQLLAMLFSMGGANSYVSSSDRMVLSISYFSSDVVIAFTMIWAFVTGITITTKPNRNFDFVFVTNRLSSSLANILFLLTASIVGGVTAILARGLLLAVRYIFFHEHYFTLPVTSFDFLIGVGATVLYLFCLSAIGYFVGALVQFSKLFVIVIPAVLIGMLFISAVINSEPYLVYVYEFYLVEPSFGLFFFKVVLTAFLFFIASIGILNRMEVRR
ncbi:hypothetical protein [Bacillus sp. S/N-304-OC-R1]|uniref:hypothetical protein n=1 Tax=Bacillus sp. S/N-304-OC-R1 TaxID=2758034 RepID=UPI001C8DEA31|nr:hypothetical protein [Bacillus sp. S/N-304-OC-R1]MBY0121257.1 hypothetical protein [Bacillus sp. S/N-304-OC-R1]